MKTLQENLKALDDLALVSLCRQGKQEAFAALMARYKPLVSSKVAACRPRQRDFDDLMQEGWLGLLSAIRSFDPLRQTPFAALAQVCVQNRLISAVKKLYSPDAATVSIEEQSDEILTQEDQTQQFLEEEEASALLSSLKKSLSSKENQVLSLFLQGLTYGEIAEKMGASQKSVDNALCRIRSKLKHIGSDPHNQI